MNELILYAINHALFQLLRETFEIFEMELFVAILMRLSLYYRREEFVCSLSGLIDVFDLQFFDRLVAVNLEYTLNEHRIGPRLVMAFVKNRDASNL